MHKCDVVYHLAAAVGVRLIVEQPVRTMVTNVQGPRTSSSRRAASASASSSLQLRGLRRSPRGATALGRRPPDLRPDHRKAVAVRGLEGDGRAPGARYHLERELDVVIVRLFNTVGPRQSGQYGMVIPRFVGAALSGLPLEVHGDGSQTRSFCHVADTVRALHGLMDAQSISGEIFNVGSTDRIKILDLAERIRELTSSRSELSFVPYDEVYGVGIEDTLHREPAIGKIESATGWRPSLDTSRILDDVIDHVRATSAPPEQDAIGVVAMENN